MTGRIAILLAAALLLGLWPSEVSADDRSFPLKIAGRIRSFDEPNQTFAIQLDESATVLTIALGEDCTFTENGAPTGEEILKQGARVQVSYFATIFTGNIAVDVATSRVSETTAAFSRQDDLVGAAGTHDSPPRRSQSSAFVN